MEEEIGLSPLEVWGTLKRPVISLKMENVYGCVGYLGSIDNAQLQLSQDEVSHVFTVPLEDLLRTRSVRNYKNNVAGNRNWERFTTELANDPEQQDRFKQLSIIGNIEEYSMPQFPSPIRSDPPIWGLTAIMTDRLFHAALREEGYPKHNFLPVNDK
eukprot:sb/3473125/